MTDPLPPTTRTSTSDEELQAIWVEPLRGTMGPVTLVDYDPGVAGPLRPRGAGSGRIPRRPDRPHRAHGLDVRAGLAAKPIIDITMVVPDSSDETPTCRTSRRPATALVIREPDWFEHRVFKGPDTNVNSTSSRPAPPEIDRMVGSSRLASDATTTASCMQQASGTWRRRPWAYVQNYADAKTRVVEAIVSRPAAAYRLRPGVVGRAATALTRGPARYRPRHAHEHVLLLSTPGMTVPRIVDPGARVVPGEQKGVASAFCCTRRKDRDRCSS